MTWLDQEVSARIGMEAINKLLREPYNLEFSPIERKQVEIVGMILHQKYEVAKIERLAYEREQERKG